MVLKCPDAGCCVGGCRLGIGGEFVPGLADTRVFEEGCHCAVRVEQRKEDQAGGGEEWNQVIE